MKLKCRKFTLQTFKSCTDERIFWNVEKNQNNKFKRKTKHDLEVEPWGQYVELKIWPCCTNSDWTPYVGCLSLKAKLEQIDTRQSPSLIQGSHDYWATCQIMTLVMFTTLTSTCSKAVTFWQSALVSGNQLVSEQDSIMNFLTQELTELWLINAS